MNCFAVWLKNPNKQLRVFHYNAFTKGDRLRAEYHAVKFANAAHNNGYPCIVEDFHMCDVGVIVHDTDK